MLHAFATYRNSDMTEGRGPMILDKVFLNEEDAEIYIRDQPGVMGRRPSQFGRDSWDGMGDWEVKPLVILESLAENEDYDIQRHVESAYSKLTPEERIAFEAHVKAGLT